MKIILRDIQLPLGRGGLNVSATVDGRVIALFGPSGAGKTSLLDVIAGLRPATSAFIQLDDRVLTDTARGVRVPVPERRMGYVPQDLSLFPHLSVMQNLRYGRKSSDDAALEKVVQTLEIQPLLTRRPAQLSGGEKQRAALGRAVLSQPSLLLLDEPLASLDQPLKARLVPYLMRIRDDFKIPMIYVTHDRHEALALADQMMVIVDGRVAQAGPVLEVFRHPASLAVAGALTVETIQPARVTARADGLVTVSLGGATLIALERDLLSSASEVLVCIRAEDVILASGSAPASALGSPRNQLRGRVLAVTRDGVMMRVELECGFRLAALLTRQACEELAVTPGVEMLALVKAPHVHLIEKVANKRVVS